MKRLLGLLFASLVLALVATGCGGDDNSDSGSSGGGGGGGGNADQPVATSATTRHANRSPSRRFIAAED